MGEIELLELILGQAFRLVLSQLSPTDSKAMVDRVFAAEVNAWADQLEKQKFGDEQESK